MTRGQPDPEVIRRHLAALREAVSNLRRHAGRTALELRANADLRRTVASKRISRASSPAGSRSRG